jgi:methionine biosynthesis protein MetW
MVLPRIEKNKWKSLIKKFGRKFIGSYTDEIIDYSSGKVLDIGCGNGYVLLSLKHKGCEVFGIEANRNAVEICSNSGLNVFHGTLEEAHFPDKFFDVVIMSQVLEHLQSPKKTLKEIYRILKPAGRVYIYCPNVEGYLSKIFGKYWHGWHIPFHFYGFTEKTIGKLADEGGFIINKVKTVTPTRFFIESLKGYLWGEKGYQNTKLSKKAMYFLTPLFMMLSSPPLRILDFVLPEKGDCLRIIMTKGEG